VLSWQKVARRIRVPLGFLFAALYLWLAHPTPTSILAGSALAIPGLWLRALASGHVRKNEQLTVTGPYAYTRNPLYLGSLVLTVGFVIASRHWVIAVIAAALFLFVYFPVILSEEDFLRAKFSQFEEYARHVPRLLPRFRPFEGSSSSFSLHLYCKHREYSALVGTVLMIAALITKAVWFPR
jgi:protein-S-isoprenylcysteine O-methyltransferase Ste14